MDRHASPRPKVGEPATLASRDSIRSWDIPVTYYLTYGPSLRKYHPSIETARLPLLPKLYSETWDTFLVIFFPVGR